MKLGDRIKSWREKRGLTQTELAEKAGTTQGYIGKLEKNNGAPSLDVLKKIAEALNIPLSYLNEEELEKLGESYYIEELISELDEETKKFLMDTKTSKAFVILAKDIAKSDVKPEDVRELLNVIKKIK